MSKKIKILDLIENLSEIRSDIPQFLFAEAIHPHTMVAVRDEILSFKKEFADVNEIDFIINSPGGSPADAYRIIRTLRNNFETVNVIVPFWAKSAATLLSLGATKIIMDEFGEFGPLDIQIAVERDDSPEIDRESALNDEYSVRRIEARSQELYYQMFTNLYSSNDIKINKIELSKQLLEYLASFYKPLLSQINPYHLGRKKRMLEIGHNYADRILSTYHPNLPDKNKAYLIDYLVNGCPDHGYVIDYNLISQFLTNVSKSSELGIIYENLLTEISSELIIQEDFTFIGFIIKQNQEENETLPIPQELLNNGIDHKTVERKQPKSKADVTKKPTTKKINHNGKKNDPAN
ncbi:hypothetical protein OA93_12295 [Flavobacterium sp. KMS]|uniref:SDH family Clp fold serine proteinase n=1 Tax=Flavobacterium sp. KMS TaxID=1566023 RepID=UPI00057FFA9F|nr:ATP-dependent Clp protease proteolytic subunit [Flavobacterium sp. KMS]KIA97761.1 hypothetical protein OA93_12295 [Flavobacterium sp. KMS]